MKSRNLKIRQIGLFLLLVNLLFSCKLEKPKDSGPEIIASDDISSILGKWIKKGPKSLAVMNFKSDGFVEMDYNADGVVDFITKIEIKEDTIIFDKDDQFCLKTGRYKFAENENYLAFNIIDDSCMPRARLTFGYWVRENYSDILEKLESNNSEGKYLNQARIFMAIGNFEKAKEAIDKYIEFDTNCSMAYLNRAEIRMYSGEFNEILNDCNSSIKLDSSNSGAFYFRGLSKFKLNDKNGACEDLYKAMELGLTFVNEIANGKCDEVWKEIALRN